MAERPYIVGNWKMNGTRAMLSEARAIDRAAQRYMKVEVAVAPPYTLIHAVHREAEQIGVGAQDCHPGAEGAHTGDISASMIADAGANLLGAPALVGGQVAEIRAVAFAGVDHRHAEFPEPGQQSADGLDGRPGQGQVVAHGVDVTAFAAEIRLHVDDD